MNVVSPVECSQPTSEVVKLERKVSSHSWIEDCNRIDLRNQTSPCGETYDPDYLDNNEDYPFCVSAEPIEGPWVSEEPENVGGEASFSESLASSILCGDVLEDNRVQTNLRKPEDSVTLPTNMPGALQSMNSTSFCGVQMKVYRGSKTPIDEETYFHSSSASIFTEDYGKVPEPIQAQIQYHRRKRLEWKFDANQPVTNEYKPQDTSTSWTVYDDLLEELEESLDASGRHCAPLALLDQSLSYDELSYEESRQLNDEIEKYLNQRFLTFQEGPPAGLHYQYLPSGSGKMCAEMATMTEQAEKDEDDSSHKKRAHCLPLCRCMPKR